ncbi:MAG: methylmalonyl-CoA mutase family protein [Woeseiaceae bacterium]|nr:methylmalonyl-CoA mutase family protein [Woeseiaceae bacterium]
MPSAPTNTATRCAARKFTGRELPRIAWSHQKIPKIARTVSTADWGELLRFLMKENLPGGYPYTGGVYPYRRLGEDPTRMFAGEGTPEKTNRRFHYLSHGQEAARLSTAFDSVTLYGEDPHERPDIFGKVGNSGVSIATVDDMKKLYSGFNLCDPATSVSMTINGPAPMILAFFMNTAIDQQVEQHLREDGALGRGCEKEDQAAWSTRISPRVRYRGDLPPGNDGARARPARCVWRQAGGTGRLRRDPGSYAGVGTRHSPGGYPERGPGAEHLHLLDRIRADA